MDTLVPRAPIPTLSVVFKLYKTLITNLSPHGAEQYHPFHLQRTTDNQRMTLTR